MSYPCDTCGAVLRSFEFVKVGDGVRCNDCWEVERRLPAYLARKAAHEQKTMTDAERLRAWAQSWPATPIMTGYAAGQVQRTMEASRTSMLKLVLGAADLMEAYEARRGITQ